MNEAANDLSEMYADANRDSDVVDIGAPFDGSWQRRRFSSLNGVLTTISIDSHKVLDVEAMSRSCEACCLKQESMENDPLAYTKFACMQIQLARISWWYEIGWCKASCVM